MADLNSPDVRIQIIVDKPGFRDAIYMSPEEFALAKDSDIEAMKDERFNNFQAAIEAARNAPAIEPSVDDLAAQKAALEASLASMQDQLAEVSTKLEVATATIGLTEIKGVGIAKVGG